MSITYQQAKRIRKTGIMSLFADQLMYEKKVTTAIKKTISLKTRGTVKGITQYFDPLNIAKMMTFGSSLGPALLGHWMGRDPRDIQYFTGRFKPIREKTGEKLTKLGRGGQGNIEGVSEVLRKMYKLLAGTHEENVKRLELAKNREEENQIEDERRHKELLDVLQGLGAGKNKGKSKLEQFGGFLKDLWKTLKPIIALMIKKAIDVALKAYSWLKDFYKWMKESGKFKDFFSRAKPFMKAAIGLELLLHSGDVGKGSDVVPTAKPESDENKLNPFYMVQRGEVKTVDEAFEKIRQIKSNMPPDRNEILQAASITDLSEPTRMKLYGTNREGLFQWLKQNPNPTDKFVIGKQIPAKVTPENKPSRETSGKLQKQPEALPSGASKESTKRFETAQTEHQLNKISKGVSVKKPSTTVNRNTVNKSNQTVPLKRRMPSVRNDEEEFRLRMLENTVLVK